MLHQHLEKFAPFVGTPCRKRAYSVVSARALVSDRTESDIVETHGFSSDDGHRPTIMCTRCSTWQHSDCMSTPHVRLSGYVCHLCNLRYIYVCGLCGERFDMPGNLEVRDRTSNGSPQMITEFMQSHNSKHIGSPLPPSPRVFELRPDPNEAMHSIPPPPRHKALYRSSPGASLRPLDAFCPGHTSIQNQHEPARETVCLS